MPSREAAERFDGTVKYYARYHPGYGEATYVRFDPLTGRP